MRSYDINGAANGAQFRYLRLRGINAGSVGLEVDAVAILPGHGGPETSTLDRAFLTNIVYSSAFGAPGAPRR